MEHRRTVDVVVPAYNEADCIVELVRRLKAVFDSEPRIRVACHHRRERLIGRHVGTTAERRQPSILGSAWSGWPATSGWTGA